jgi:uncharacterized protein YneF (UPF0154 family)
MSNEVLIAIIGVTSALLGSLVGGIASYFSTRSMRRLDWQLSVREKEIERNRILYNEFLAEANRLMLLSFGKKVSDTTDFSTIAAMESQIRMTSLSLGERARKITACTMSYNVKGDPKTEENFPLLRDEFIEACRQEIDASIKANA